MRSAAERCGAGTTRRLSLLGLWLPCLLLYAAHQLEESVGDYYAWVLAHEAELPLWADVNLSGLARVGATPARMLITSTVQVLAVSTVAYLVRRRLRLSRLLLNVFLVVLLVVFVWHLSMLTVIRSPAPALWTSLLGVLVAPILLVRVNRAPWPARPSSTRRA